MELLYKTLKITIFAPNLHPLTRNAAIWGVIYTTTTL